MHFLSEEFLLFRVACRPYSSARLTMIRIDGGASSTLYVKGAERALPAGYRSSGSTIHRNGERLIQVALAKVTRAKQIHVISTVASVSPAPTCFNQVKS